MMEVVSLAASIATLLELAGTAKHLGELFACAPSDIVTFAKDISRLSDSLYLLAEAISDPIVQTQYRRNDIRILDRHLNDARIALQQISSMIQKYQKYHLSRSVIFRLLWMKDSRKTLKLYQSLKQVCHTLLVDCSSIQLRTSARAQATLNDLRLTATAILARSVPQRSDIPAGSSTVQPVADTIRSRNDAFSMALSRCSTHESWSLRLCADTSSPSAELATAYRRYYIPRQTFRNLESALYILLSLLQKQTSDRNPTSTNTLSLLGASRILSRLLARAESRIQYATLELYEMALDDLSTLRELHGCGVSGKRVLNALVSRTRLPLAFDSSWLTHSATDGSWDIDVLQKLLSLSPSWRLASQIRDGTYNLSSDYTPNIGSGDDLPIVALAFIEGLLRMAMLIPELPMDRTLGQYSRFRLLTRFRGCGNFTGNIYVTVGNPGHFFAQSPGRDGTEDFIDCRFLEDPNKSTAKGTHILVQRRAHKCLRSIGGAPAPRICRRALVGRDPKIEEPMPICHHQPAYVKASPMMAVEQSNLLLLTIVLTPHPLTTLQGFQGQKALRLLLIHSSPSSQATNDLRTASTDLPAGRDSRVMSLRLLTRHENARVLQIVSQGIPNLCNGHVNYRKTTYLRDILMFEFLCHYGAELSICDIQGLAAVHRAMIGITYANAVLWLASHSGMRSDLAETQEVSSLNRAIETVILHEIGVAMSMEALGNMGVLFDEHDSAALTPLLLTTTVGPWPSNLASSQQLFSQKVDATRTGPSGGNLLHYICYASVGARPQIIVSALDYLLEKNIRLDPTEFDGQANTALDYLFSGDWDNQETDEFTEMKERATRRLSIMAERIGQKCETSFIFSLWRAMVNRLLRGRTGPGKESFYNSASKRRILDFLSELCAQKTGKRQSWFLRDKHMMRSLPWKENCFGVWWVRFLLNRFEGRSSNR